MRTVEFRPRAQLDVESAVLYRGMVLGRPASAKRLNDALWEALDYLAEIPEVGHVFQGEVLEGQGYRWWLVEHHKLVYTYTAEKLVIWRFFHERQDIDDYGLEWLSCSACEQ